MRLGQKEDSTKDIGKVFIRFKSDLDYASCASR
jgi:hypothetical protein